MKKITLTNDFHNTEVTVIPQLVTEGRHKGHYKISHKIAMRLRNELCGRSDCTCGGNFGERGQQGEVVLDVINVDYDRNFIVQLINRHDGSRI